MPNPNAGDRDNVRVALLALLVAIVGAASMTYYHLRIFLPRAAESRAAAGISGGYFFGNDFYPVWLTARAARTSHADPYSPDMTRAIQTGLFSRPLDLRTDPPADYRQFAYPAFTDLLLWPLGYFEFRQVRLILAVVLPLLTIASFWFWFEALGWKIHPVWFVVFLVLALSTYQLLEAFFAEQPGLIVGFVLPAAAYALRKNRLMLAGALSALTLIKPQMTGLLIVYLLLWSFSDRRRAALWQAFSAVTIALVILSLAIWPHWIHEWITILLGYHHYATPSLVALLFAPRLPAYVGTVLIACVLIAAAILAWKQRDADVDSPSFWFTVSILLALTAVSLLPGQAVYDHVILIPGILLVIQRRHLLQAKWTSRSVLAAGALVLFWPWVAAFALALVRPLVPTSFFDSSIVATLPIRSAAALPFATLALLCWTSRVSPAS